MSSPELSRSAAAKLLGVSTRTLHTYEKQGLLSVRKDGNVKLFDPVEVEELRQAQQETKKRSVVTLRELAFLKARLARVEADLAVMARILDTKSEPLRMNTAYARDLFAAAAAQVQAGAWEPGEMQPWSEIFLRIDEEDFRTIAEGVEDPKPWKVFLRLCVAMSAHISTLDGYLSSMDLQGLHRRLVEGRRRMRVAALIYSDMYSVDQEADLRRYALADAPSSIGDTLDRVLKSRKKRT